MKDRKIKHFSVIPVLPVFGKYRNLLIRRRDSGICPSKNQRDKTGMTPCWSQCHQVRRINWSATPLCVEKYRNP
ncbi:hypothetical protein JW964_02340 [candidate division KSB1 bacterium]|nr:hypothetical protein [candidate division KSB1 bacterium]